MGDPGELALVVKALKSGLGGCAERLLKVKKKGSTNGN